MYHLNEQGKPDYNANLQTAIATFKEYFTREVKAAYFAFDAIVKNAPGLLARLKEGLQRRLLIALLANVAESGVESGLKTAQIQYAGSLGNLAGYAVRALAFIYYRHQDKEEKELLEKAKKFIRLVNQNQTIESIIDNTSHYLTTRFLPAFEELGHSSQLSEDIQLLAEFFAASLLDILLEYQPIEAISLADHIQQFIVPLKADNELYKKELPFKDTKLSFNKKFNYAPTGHAWTVRGLLLHAGVCTPEGEYLTKSDKEDRSAKYPAQILCHEMAIRLGYKPARPTLQVPVITDNRMVDLSTFETLNSTELGQSLKSYAQTHFKDFKITIPENYAKVFAPFRKTRAALVERLNASTPQVFDPQLINALKAYLKTFIVLTYQRYVNKGQIADARELLFFHKEISWLKKVINGYLQHQAKVANTTPQPLQQLSRQLKDLLIDLLQTHDQEAHEQNLSNVSSQTVALVLLTLLDELFNYTAAKTVAHGLITQPEDCPIVSSFIKLKQPYSEQLMVLLNDLGMLDTIIQQWKQGIHWYTSEELITLLKLYTLPHLGTVTVLTDLGDSPLFNASHNNQMTAAQPTDVLKARLTRYNQERLHDNNNVLIPLCLAPRKWSLIWIAYPAIQEKTTHIYFISPSDNQIPEALAVLLKDEVLFGKDVQLEAFCLGLADEPAHTGVWVIEHARALLNQETLPLKGLNKQKARQAHRETLEQHGQKDVIKEVNLIYQKVESLSGRLQQQITQLETLGHPDAFFQLFTAGARAKQDHQNAQAKLIAEIRQLQHSFYFTAIELGDLDTVKQLIKHAKLDENSCDQTGHSALHVAAFHGYAPILNFLLDKAKSANVSLQTFVASNGSTLLHSAVFGGQFYLVPQLLAAGCDLHAVNAPNPHGAGQQTVLHIAAKAKIAQKQALIKLLLEQGAEQDKDKPDQSGRTPLHYLVDRNLLDQAHVDEQLIGLLISDANINLQDDYGETALHIIACKRLGQAHRLITLLCQKGANVTLTNQEGLTALDILELKQQQLEKEVRILTAKKQNPKYSADASLATERQQLQVQLNDLQQARTLLQQQMAQQAQLQPPMLQAMPDANAAKPKCVIS